MLSPIGHLGPTCHSFSDDASTGWQCTSWPMGCPSPLSRRLAALQHDFSLTVKEGRLPFAIGYPDRTALL